MKGMITMKNSKKIFCAACVAAAILFSSIAALTGCANVDAATQGEYSLVVHYYRYNKDYAGWNAWVWPSVPNGDGGGFEFGKPDKDGFVTAHINVDGEVEIFGLIVRRKSGGNDWAEKDTPDDRFTGAKEVWVVQGDPALYTEKPDVRAMPILFAVADSPDTITAALLKAPKSFGSFAVYDGEKKLAGAAVQGKHDRQVRITLTDKITDPSKRFILRDESGGFADKEITMRNILDGYVYDGADLGLSYSAAQSGFKVWAPTAASVSVALYDDAGTYNSGGKVTDNVTENLTPMQKEAATGVWSAAVSGDLAGKYYLYRVEFANGKVNWGVDPYAKAVSANGQRGFVLNLADTNPELWESDTKPDFSGKWQDAVLYELHVRDFSIDEESGMKNKGKFLAFTERETTNSAGAATGVDHLVNLGITHVHLLPSYDFASLNELTVDDPASTNAKFNWGYDPQNYNVPEGSYSSNPADPKARIREFKEMVQSLHSAGIRVVMDVVYNHTYATGGGPFESMVPGYYYRTTDNGSLSNGSGCGNEVASERPMVRKFIVDSCAYWAKEYNIDGYRFDLMAIIDRETMRQVTETVRRDVPTFIIYGEPWQAGGSVLPAQQQTSVGGQRGMGIAIFNDRIRGSIKGGTDDASKGFATGQDNTEKGIVNGVRGSVEGFADCASESINYVTAHDNLNLWDKISLSLGAKDLANDPYSLIAKDKPLLENNAVKSVLLANGIVLTSQGIPFFQAGDEMLRSKLGDHNSYSSPDNVNRIRWENAGKYQEVIQYYAGLITLRKAHPAFRMDSKAEMDNITVLSAQNKLVSFTVNGTPSGDEWNTIFVAYNAGNAAQTLKLPEAGTWYQTVNAEKAGIDTLGDVTGSVTLPPFSMAVLYQ
jgi:pullulanase